MANAAILQRSQPSVGMIQRWWNSLSALIVFLFIAWVFGRLLELFRGLEQRVAESAGELLRESETRRVLQQQLLAAGSSERALVGQELHDDVCQHLVGTALAAKVLAHHLAQQANARTGEAESIVLLLEEAIAKARQCRSTNAKRPSASTRAARWRSSTKTSPIAGRERADRSVPTLR